eukprot:COSAG05_NODE_3145_length_2287_cov_192.952640_1_plen_66_part_10
MIRIGAAYQAVLPTWSSRLLYCTGASSSSNSDAVSTPVVGIEEGEGDSEETRRRIGVAAVDVGLCE